MLFIADATLLKIPSKDKIIPEALVVALNAKVPSTNIAMYRMKNVWTDSIIFSGRVDLDILILNIAFG